MKNFIKLAATLAALAPVAAFAAEPGVVQASFQAACCGLPCCP